MRRSPLSRVRVFAGGIAAAIALLVVVGGFTPQGQAVFADFLAQFRSERFVAIPVDTTAAKGALPSFEGLGTVTVPDTLKAQTVATLQEASQRSGLTLKSPAAGTLPAAVGSDSRSVVTQGAESRLTFSKAKARTWFDAQGRSDLSLPDKLDGASLVVGVPAAVITNYGPLGDSAPGVVVGQARELTAGVEGNASFEEVRDFMLGLPGIPSDVAQQIRNLRDPRTTLPVPIPTGQGVTSSDVTINGAPALQVTQGNQTGIIWQQNGMIYGVAGDYPAATIKAIAEGLR